MNSLQLISVLLISVAMFGSCTKSSSSSLSMSSCSTTCKNGGSVTPACGCNCLPGYSGANCQNFSTTVSLNPATVYQLCPTWLTGDNDFDGSLTIAWSVEQFLSSDHTKIFASVYAYFKEYPSTGNTSALIDPNLKDNQILLYTAPTGKKVYSVDGAGGAMSTGTINPSRYFWGTSAVTNVTSNNFFYRIEFIGDTDGQDLPCTGSDQRSRCKVYFKSFNITLTDL